MDKLETVLNVIRNAVAAGDTVTVEVYADGLEVCVDIGPGEITSVSVHCASCDGHSCPDVG